ncbi:MAG: hypothetical protein Ct9H300mP23_05910 [Nitrospinota bacterium]|nr:MAG: hypothetical protein Ct9H300mP23_05910 [Nitrospinota bacterium]
MTTDSLSCYKYSLFLLQEVKIRVYCKPKNFLVVLGNAPKKNPKTPSKNGPGFICYLTKLGSLHHAGHTAHAPIPPIPPIPPYHHLQQDRDYVLPSLLEDR